MDFQYLYSRTDGRISRKTFWWGALGLMVSGALVALILGITTLAVAGSLFSNSFAAMGITLMGFLGINALLSYPAYCLAVKRRHDRNDRGIDVLIYIGLNLSWSLVLVLVIVSGATSNLQSPPVIFAGYALQLFGLYMLVVLGFLKGTEGPNQYGPDPLGNTAAAAA